VELEVVVSLVILLCAAYVFYFGMIARPQWSIYAYLLVWMLVPKASRFFWLTGGEDLPTGVTVFTFFEAAASLAILVALVMNKEKGNLLKRYPILGWTSGLFLAATTGSYLAVSGYLSWIASLEVSRLWDHITSQTLPLEPLLQFLPSVYGVVFLLGCAAFITNKRHVETIFALMVLMGMELLIEVIAFYYLNLFPPVFAWVNWGGRFASLVYTNYDMVGLLMVPAILCCLYFILTRKLYKLVFWVPLLFLPSYLTYQRTSLLSLFTAIGFLLYYATPRLRKVVAWTVGFSCLFFLFFDPEAELISYFQMNFMGENRPDFFEISSLFGRLILYTRTLEVSFFLFPFGAGLGMVRYAMSFNLPEYNLWYDAIMIDPSQVDFYGSVVNLGRATATHNTYLEYLAECGALGLISLAMFITAVVRNFFEFRRRWAKRAMEYHLSTAQACVYAILLGFGVYNLFESAARLYFLYALFFYLTFLLKDLSQAPKKFLRAQ
jgi:hypothetical protein